MRKIDAAYLAGLIDGEGSIFINRNKVAYRAGVVVCMVDISALSWAKRKTGVGQIRPQKASTPRARKSWRWTVWSREASALLTELLPFLLLKKAHALNLISFQSKLRAGPGRDVKKQRQHYRMAKRLNRRGSQWT